MTMKASLETKAALSPENHPYLGGFVLLPGPAGKCANCAVYHTPDQPHNQQSLFYQYDFFGRHGRWPTWKDAMAHCSDEVKRRWTEELAKRGATV